jgi:hypothetical protein
VQFTVSAHGTTILGGQRSSNVLEVDDNGRFEQELPDGLYAVTASIIKEFEGSRYLLHMHPDDNKHEQTKLNSKPGILKNFTWKLTGLRPGYDPKHAFSYYGQTVHVYDTKYLGEPEDQLQGAYGPDAKAVVTLTPVSKLIDGSDGKPITITAPLAEIGTTMGHADMDQPIATYKVTAKIVTKDGREHPARVGPQYAGAGEESMEAKFVQRSEYDSIQPIKVFVAK